MAQASQDLCLRGGTIPQFSPAVAVHKNIALVAHTEIVGFLETVVGGRRSGDGGETFSYLGSLPSPYPGCPARQQGQPALLASEEGVFYLSFLDDRTRVFRSLDGGKSFAHLFSIDDLLVYQKLAVRQEKVYLLGWQAIEGQEPRKWALVLFIGGAEEVTGPIVVAVDALFGEVVELGIRLYCVYPQMECAGTP
ncbi:MAG: hypothetical protein ACUVQS_04675 [Candidatus Bipolaricaulaceae bacterium]